MRPGLGVGWGPPAEEGRRPRSQAAGPCFPPLKRRGSAAKDRGRSGGLTDKARPAERQSERTTRRPGELPREAARPDPSLPTHPKPPRRGNGPPLPALPEAAEEAASPLPGAAARTSLRQTLRMRTAPPRRRRREAAPRPGPAGPEAGREPCGTPGHAVRRRFAAGRSGSPEGDRWASCPPPRLCPPPPPPPLYRRAKYLGIGSARVCGPSCRRSVDFPRAYEHPGPQERSRPGELDGVA